MNKLQNVRNCFIPSCSLIVIGLLTKLKMPHPNFDLEKLFLEQAFVFIVHQKPIHSPVKRTWGIIYFQVVGFILPHNFTGMNYLFAKIPPQNKEFQRLLYRTRSTTIFNLTESLTSDKSFTFFHTSVFRWVCDCFSKKHFHETFFVV